MSFKLLVIVWCKVVISFEATYKIWTFYLKTRITTFKGYWEPKQCYYPNYISAKVKHSGENNTIGPYWGTDSRP